MTSETEGVKLSAIFVFEQNLHHKKKNRPLSVNCVNESELWFGTGVLIARTLPKASYTIDADPSYEGEEESWSGNKQAQEEARKI